MPDGHVTWYDPARGEGVVEHNGREYAVVAADVDPHARHAGAPVHFDVAHGERGDVATAVVARPGSRTSHTSGRVGDLTGAHDPSQKGHDAGDDQRQARRRAYGEQPQDLVDDWVAALASGQVDRAVSLYAPDAVIAQGDQRIAGEDDIRRWLARSPLHGAEAGRADVTGDGADGFVVTWPPMPGDDAALETRLVVRDGRIAEQETREAA